MILFCQWARKKSKTQTLNHQQQKKQSKDETIRASCSKAKSECSSHPSVSDDLLGSALRGLWEAAGFSLPSERRQEYICHSLSAWTLRHVCGCFQCNFSRLGSVPAAWSRGAGVAPCPRCPQDVSNHYSGAHGVTLGSMVRQLKDMVNKCKPKLQRSCFSVLSDLYSLWIYFPLTPWN